MICFIVIEPELFLHGEAIHIITREHGGAAQMAF